MRYSFVLLHTWSMGSLPRHIHWKILICRLSDIGYDAIEIVYFVTSRMAVLFKSGKEREDSSTAE